MALVSALGSLSSVALSSARVPSVYHSLPFSLLPGDTSTLQKKGHFYFALTLEHYSLCLERRRPAHRRELAQRHEHYEHI